MSAGTDARIVGIDCAVDPRKVGLAVADVVAGKAHLISAVTVRDVGALDAWLVAHLRGRRALLALDAPLGWPAPLAAALGGHAAGAEVDATAHALFRRGTDDLVHAEVGQRPLDVGADRIARCAPAALALLGRLRRALDVELPLAWTPGRIESLSCIEVYPAATLASRAVSSRGYKGAEARAARGAILDQVVGELALTAEHRDRALDSDHVLDAILCVLAGFDFLRGEVRPVTDPVLARREGWIWFRGNPATPSRVRPPCTASPSP